MNPNISVKYTPYGEQYILVNYSQTERKVRNRQKMHKDLLNWEQKAIKCASTKVSEFKKDTYFEDLCNACKVSERVAEWVLLE